MKSNLRRYGAPVLLATLATLGATAAHAAQTYEFVCTAPADCAGDKLFELSIELNDAVIKPGGAYSTGSDNAAGITGWSGAGGKGNGFNIGGDDARLISSEQGYVAFTFDDSGNISGLFVTEDTSNDNPAPVAGAVIDFTSPGAGKISYTGPDTVTFRGDMGCPPDPPGTFCTDSTPIKGEWRKK